MGVNRFSPGCGCCGCGCIDECRQDGGSGNTFLEICDVETVITSAPSSVTYWSMYTSPGSTSIPYNYYWHQVTLSDFDQLNGTYAMTKDDACDMRKTVSFSMGYSVDYFYHTSSSCAFQSSASGTATIKLLLGKDARPGIDYWHWPRLDDSDIPTSPTYTGQQWRFLLWQRNETYPTDCRNPGATLRVLSPAAQFGAAFLCTDTAQTDVGSADITATA